MNKIIESFKNKKVRYGSFSTLMIIIAVAILILINLVAERLNIKADMTVNKTYSISDESKDILSALNEDVTIYALARTGEEESMFSSAVGQLTFKELLTQYERISGRISVEYRDPYLYPTFAEQYADADTTVPINSVIVVGAKRHKVILPTEMITTDYDMNSFQEYVTTIDIEPRITNAINYVTAESTSVVYSVSGTNEAPLPDTLKSQISMANYDIKDVDITLSDIPEDATILFVTQPSRDWTAQAAEKVRVYLQNGGRAVFAISFVGDSMPNLNGVLETYGVTIGEYIVLEGSSDHYVMSNPMYMVPDVADHDITKSIRERSYRPMMIQSSGVEQTTVKKNSITVEPILTTSDLAYGKTNTQATTIQKEPDDVDGPITMMAAVTDSYYTDEQHVTKLVVIANASFTSEQVNEIMGGANFLLLVDSLNWLQDKDDTVFIPSKSPESTATLTMTQNQVVMFAFLSAITVPLSIVAVGLFVWLRRRHS